MADYGEKVAEKAIAQVVRELRAVYKTAQRELAEKLKDFEQRFKAKDAEKRAKLMNGEITTQEYKDWLRGQVFMRNQWESNIRQVNAVMLDSNRQAMRIINEGKLNVFAENYNYNAFLAEKQMAVSFNLYSAEAVARLIYGDPKLLPEWKIDEPKDYDWNYKKVNNIVNQGIIQGESVDQIGQRLCQDLSTFNENKMRMFARTAITGAQNGGRQKQMEDAAEMGIDVLKQWLATHDSRTRDSHRMIDGEEVPYNEEFSNGLEFPGDPDGDPREVYNCRCTVVSIYPKYEDRSKPNWRDEVEIDGESYEEWKNEKSTRGEVSGNEKRQYFGIDGMMRAAKEIESDSPQEIIYEYFEKLGYNELPKVVDAREFEETESEYPLLFRGLHEESGEKFKEQFLYGERFIGNGANGRGNNFSTRKEESEGYAGKNGSLITAKLAKDAKVISDDELVKIVIEMRRSAKEKGYTDELLQLCRDPGSVAAMFGYDAVWDEKLGWINLLNRKALIIRDETLVIDDKSDKIKAGRSEPAALRYVNNQEQFYSNAGKIKPISDYEDVVCHGDKNGFVFKDMDGRESNVSVEKMASMLKENPEYRGGNIRLISCEAGADGSIVAQGLADKMGVDVMAPTDVLWVHEDGSMGIGETPIDNTGEWKVFHPRR